MKNKVLAFVVPLCAAFIFAADDPRPTTELWEHRNLGKAFYENPDTHQQAAEELRKALQLAPNSVRERINYGLGLLRAGQTDAGVAELIRAQKQDPALPYTWFNLGIAYKHAGDYDKAIEQFQGMIKLVPNEPVAHYNLATALRSKNDNQAALPEFLEAERLNADLAGPHFQLFTLYQRAGDKQTATRERQLFEEAKKKNAGAAVPEDMEWCFYAELYDPPEPRPSAETEPTRYKEQALSSGWDSSHSRMQVIDAEGNGHADLLVWSPERVELWKRGVDLSKNSGLENLKDVRDIAPGDFDNDGLTDLCIVTGAGAAIFHNDHGVFKKQLDLPNAQGAGKALAIDYDHDNDLDLLLFGSQTALWRNDGNGKFEDKSESFPAIKGGKALDAVVIALRGDTAARDIVVSYADRGGVLYTDKLNGVFEASELPALSAGSAGLDAQDFDHDGLIDVVVYRPEIYAVRNHEGTLELARGAKTAPSSIRADFNGDGREDYARLLPDGSVHLYTNVPADQHWLSVQIIGVKNLKSATNATVEVKSGPYYEKRVYQGVPLSFATDGRTTVDTVRITWPNGLIQNETGKKSSEALKVEEAQRLSGSCPMIFTWNGEKFQFITDVLGVAPLGASSGDGNYFPVDHDEYVQIPGSALKAQNGKYQVHITEELHEVSYLDQVQLIALDHPADVQIYTNDKFKSPPYPEFRLFGGRSRVHPIRALDERGRNVTGKLAAIDSRYPDGFPHNSAGVAGLHTLDLDFGKAAPTNRAVLVLNGWVDWADGSTFLGASQDGQGGLVFPYLQVKDKAGKWQTVVGDMGIPSGKPKTIAVDLTGKFLSSSREVRIVTNLCVYWDEIFLLEDSRSPQARLTPMNAERADLQFRGFSQAVIDPRRQQPEQFLYDQVRPVSNWNPTPGFYTRYGDVRPLVTRADDKLLIMGSGDEVKLEYGASQLPPLPQGWTRDFLLLVDGWAKDADPNTAFSQSVTPLPFHAMSAYPYKGNEQFPIDEEHRQYQKQYLTRPALRLIRPLANNQKTGE
ncbi:MAG: VCBS repeat-containing protein [Acidobacteriaceae bacterium]|nr:VCBS repeat-containing protein [Acidobacteriaceae bacterium]